MFVLRAVAELVELPCVSSLGESRVVSVGGVYSWEKVGEVRVGQADIDFVK